MNDQTYEAPADRLEKVINDAITTTLKSQESPDSVETTDGPFSSIEEYKRITGKRFRMTKTQKARGISRNEAFQEFIKDTSIIK